MCGRIRQEEQRKKGDSDAICPFFRYHTQLNIVCEGAIPDTNVRILFPDRESKTLHYNTFCCGRWTYCEQAKKTEDKYEDGE